MASVNAPVTGKHQTKVMLKHKAETGNGGKEKQINTREHMTK
jgi:hypothetical protein